MAQQELRSEVHGEVDPSTENLFPKPNIRKGLLPLSLMTEELTNSLSIAYIICTFSPAHLLH